MSVSMWSWLLLSQVFIVACAGCSDKSEPSKPNPGPAGWVNSGEWTLRWGQTERRFGYGIAGATLQPDGSLTLVFLASDLSQWPLASAGITNAVSVTEGEYTDCSLMIAYGEDLSEMAAAPLDPLKTEVQFTMKQLTAGGRVSGRFRGDLATAEYAEMTRVTIVDAEFADVIVGEAR